MNVPARLLPLLLVVLTLPVSQAIFQGCATIINGPTEKVKFDSKPPGATVYVNGKPIGQTPRLVVLSRFRSPQVRFELAGFQPYELKLQRNYNYTVVLNNTVGFAPIVVDAATGALYEIDLPEHAPPGLVAQPWYTDQDNLEYSRYKTLFVGVLLEPLPNARKIGQMQRQ
jgi:hypothetical protein